MTDLRSKYLGLTPTSTANQRCHLGQLLIIPAAMGIISVAYIYEALLCIVLNAFHMLFLGLRTILTGGIFLLTLQPGLGCCLHHILLNLG